MRKGSIFFLIILASCTDATSSSATETPAEIINHQPESDDNPTLLGKKLHLDGDFTSVDPQEVTIDISTKDSMIYQIIFALEKDKYVAIAQPQNETFEGVRLQYITQSKNGKYKVRDSSSPGYDSPMLYPTFFKNDKGEYIILANTGTSDSWGLRVYSLIGNKFKDIGFIDMATIERREYPDEDGKMHRYGNIAKHTQIHTVDGRLIFSFHGNKMILFEDLDHHHDVNFTEGEYAYRWNNKTFELIIP